MVTRQLRVERRTGKDRRSKTNVLLLYRDSPPLTREWKSTAFKVSREVTHVMSNWHNSFEIKRLKY